MESKDSVGASRSGHSTPQRVKSGGEIASPADVDAVRKAMNKAQLVEDGADTAAIKLNIPEEAEDTSVDTRDNLPAPKHKLRHAILTCDVKAFWDLQEKGSISNFITFLWAVIGIAGYAIASQQDGVSRVHLNVWLCIRAIGVFGFSGGITNFIAIKMLFDRVPGLIGSGIITKQFKEIRQTVMDTVLETFFDSEFLGKYIGEKATELEDSKYIQKKIRSILECEDIDKVVDKHLNMIMTRPEGMMLMMVGMDGMSLKPMVLPFIHNLDSEIAPMVTSHIDPSKMIDTKAIRSQVQELMQTKMEMLTPEMVKGLVEDMIRKHLGWLIVWGNIFGGLIGLLCQLGSLEN
eukprot:m.209438 g.209438  ORF g.209438 m.209438 type:complete len:348 (-) comp33039_c4_seq1:280-1323(-)